MQNEKCYAIVHCTEDRIKKELSDFCIDWDKVGIVWDCRRKMISSIPTYMKDEWSERFTIVDSKTLKIVGYGSCQTRNGIWEPIRFRFVDE